MPKRRVLLKMSEKKKQKETQKLHPMYLFLIQAIEDLNDEAEKYLSKNNELEFNEDDLKKIVELEEIKGKGKKQEVVLHSIPFTTIKSTKVQIKF